MLMLSEKVGECIGKAIEDPTVNRMLKLRGNHANLEFASIYSKVLKQEHNRTRLAMVVRIGFDFKQQEIKASEDIWVDVLYCYEYSPKREVFDVQEPHIVPELPDPVRETSN